MLVIVTIMFVPLKSAERVNVIVVSVCKFAIVILS